MESMIILAFSKELNGYLGVTARMTSTGYGKDGQLYHCVDVSKDHLDAHRLPDGAAKQFSNDAAGHKALIRWVKAMPADRIVFEATGPYSQAMELALTGAGLPTVKVNPHQARRFAEALGTLARTDALDAAMLARMGKALELLPRPAQSINIPPLARPSWSVFPASAT